MHSMYDIRVNNNVNYGLWVIMMQSCMFINFIKCTTLGGVVDNSWNHACVGAMGMWEISVFSSQFCCDYKTGIKT